MNIDFVKSAIGAGVSGIGFLYNKFASMGLLGSIEPTKAVESISQLTFTGAAVYASVHLFRALIKEKERSEAMLKGFSNERLNVAERHSSERREEADRHAEAVAKIYAATREEYRIDRQIAEESRQEMILELRGLRETITLNQKTK